MEWLFAEAKKRFSEVVNRALLEGPQRVLWRKDAVVIIAERDYEKPTGARPSFKDFLLGHGSDVDFEGLDLARDRSPMGETRL